MSARVVITAIGARTPVGATAESSAAAIRAGIGRIQREDDAPLAMDASLDPSARVGFERMVASGQRALAELMGKLAMARIGSIDELPVLVGLPEVRPGWPASAPAAFGARLLEGTRSPPRLAFEALPLGHAAALEGVRRAKERIERGEAGVVLVGGVDSYIDHDALLWLEAQRRRRNESTRGGTIPGEAAAFIALMRRELAERAEIAPLAEVVSAASALERIALDSEEPALGEGLTQAVGVALAQASSVDEIFCDLNGERRRSEEWGFVALRLGGALRDLSRVHSAVTSCGDVGAAAGALGLVTCVQAWRRGHARGPHALVWGSSDAGLRSALLLNAPQGGSRWVR